MRSYVENNDTFVEKKKRKRMAVKIDGMCISGAGASGEKKAEGAREKELRKDTGSVTAPE